ncbi:MAG TPA: hypothetical protein VEV84_15845 [Pyrinomonadaceae bacterium]|nr:hypothetical protein [Pyrinomonadaceae bacterium]
MRNLERFWAPEDVKRWRSLALGIGGIGSIIVLGVALLFPDQREQALRSWLLGYIFWTGVGIGSLGLLLTQYLTGGAWGVVSRRILEAGSRTLPIIVILFIPIAVGVGTRSVYNWTHLAPTEHVMEQRGIFATPWAWILRSAIYFALFGFMAWYLNKRSWLQDRATTAEESANQLIKASRFSGPTIIFWCLTVSFAAVDWVMCLDPHFSSTIYGMLFIAGWALSAVCFATVMMALLYDKAPMNRVLGRRHFHDYGKLMLTFVMVWAYFNFAQYLIIWSGNVPEETGWFVVRETGIWGWIGAILIFFHFAFPFLVLLKQDFKRKAKWLASLAVFILVMRVFDMLYLIGPNPRISMPEARNGTYIVSWMDALAPIAVGGIWLWWYFGELLKRPMAPANDPYFESAVEHGKGH